MKSYRVHKTPFSDGWENWYLAHELRSQRSNGEKANGTPKKKALPFNHFQSG
jgi:hypothetical protein